MNILHPDDVQSLFETWSVIVASGEPGEIQARMRRFDGGYRWFLLRVAPLRDDSGQLIAWWGINVEIDDRKNAEDLLAGEKRLLEMMARGEPLPRCSKRFAEFSKSTPAVLSVRFCWPIPRAANCGTLQRRAFHLNTFNGSMEMKQP